MHPRLLQRILTILRRFGYWLRGESYLCGKMLGASVAGVLAIVALAVLFLVATRDSAPLDHSRGTALEALRISAAMEDDLSAIETAHGDFLITGEVSLIAGFEQAQAALNGRLDALRSVVAKEASQAAALQRFEASFRQWERQFALPQIRARADQKDVTLLPDYTEGKSWLAAAHESLHSFRGTTAAPKEGRKRRGSDSCDR